MSKRPRSPSPESGMDVDPTPSAASASTRPTPEDAVPPVARRTRAGSRMARASGSPNPPPRSSRIRMQAEAAEARIAAAQEAVAAPGPSSTTALTNGGPNSDNAISAPRLRPTARISTGGRASRMMLSRRHVADAGPGGVDREIDDGDSGDSSPDEEPTPTGPRRTSRMAMPSSLSMMRPPTARPKTVIKLKIPTGPRATRDDPTDDDDPSTSTPLGRPPKQRLRRRSPTPPPVASGSGSGLDLTRRRQSIEDPDATSSPSLPSPALDNGLRAGLHYTHPQSRRQPVQVGSSRAARVSNERTTVSKASKPAATSAEPSGLAGLSPNAETPNGPSGSARDDSPLSSMDEEDQKMMEELNRQGEERDEIHANGATNGTRKRGTETRPTEDRDGLVDLSGNASGSGSGSTVRSASDEPFEIDPETGERRLSAKDKGKGKAKGTVRFGAVEEEVDMVDATDMNGDDVEDSLDDGDSDAEGEDDPVIVREEGVLDVDSGLQALNCPICMNQPTQAVMTACGHILCAVCLLNGLIASLARGDNRAPAPRVVPRNQQGRVSRRHGRMGPVPVPGLDGGGPNKWKAEELREAWWNHLNSKYEKSLKAKGIQEDKWEEHREKDKNAPKKDKIQVREVNGNGVWSIDGKDHLVEGDCPVCRKPLPGGFAPPYTNIGAVTPLEIYLAPARGGR